MDENTLRIVLGAIAGGLAGTQVGKPGTVNKVGAAVAGATVGGFSAEVVNALKEIAGNRTGQGPISDPAAVAQAYLHGTIIGKAGFLALIEVALGESIESILRTRLRVQTDDQLKAVIRERASKNWPAVEEAFSRIANEHRDGLKAILSMMGLPTDQIDFDLDRALSAWKSGMRLGYNA